MNASRDKFTPEKRSWIMSRVKCRDTSPEIKLRKALWSRGLRYRLHDEGLPGKPDIVFSKVKVVVFVDGAFWHGKKLSYDRLNKMSPYWQEKISRNVARDEKVTKLLEAEGYMVLRYLDRDVQKDTASISEKIENAVRERSKK